MEGLITGAFAEFLKSNRDALNAKFAQAKQTHPNLDPTTFKDLLLETVAPIVESVDQHTPATTREVATILYDVALDLLTQDFLGANSRYPFIAQGWRDLLPHIPQHIAAAPRDAISAMTNALYNLSLVPNARPQEWIASMCALAPLANDAPSFLQAGQIAAWRAGLAHYRVDALDLCKKIEPSLARAALGLPTTNAIPIETLVARLSADPWLRPENVREQASDARTLKIVARVGAFRGLGGLFQSPPLVMAMGDLFVVKDGESVWLLVADCFGATFHRADGTSPKPNLAPFDLDRRGKVTLGKSNQTFSELDGWVSAASTRTTLAATTDLSFAIFLIAAVEN
jgi:hypothetical protein